MMAASDSSIANNSEDTIQIALVGNPNTGKTTLFNRLTGAKQRVGNYPGVTVEKKYGELKLTSGTVTLIDLPGTYSLAAASADERVVIDALTGHIDGFPQPDVVVCVIDATNLMRNLFLSSQVADIGIPSVVALNMMDAAEEEGVAVDAEALSKRLGVPVVPIVASKGRGIEKLKKAINDAIGSESHVAPMPWPEPVEKGFDILSEKIQSDIGKNVSRIELLRILFDIDSAIPARLGWNDTQAMNAITSAREILSESGLNPVSAEAILRYARLGELLDGVLVHRSESNEGSDKFTRDESVDRLLTHRVWGLIIFTGLMWVVFQSIYWFAGFFMDLIEIAFSAISNVVGSMLVSTPMIQSMVVDGMISGIGSVLIFLPQILILFFFIALLEDTGYMARAAFLMDKLFSWCGLNGKSFVPMLSSYACAIPGVMATRSIDDPKARLVTILIAPLMSCSARLPVYVLLIGAFIEPIWGPVWAGTVLVGMHFLGFAVAIPVAIILNKFVVKGSRIPFVLEMPPYRTPQLSSIFWRMWQAGEKFLKRAGTIIFAMTIIIWAMCYFPRSSAVETAATEAFIQSVATEQNISVESIRNTIDEGSDTALITRMNNVIEGAYIEQSYLGRFGKSIQPLFAPAGFDWKITVGVVASFPAREVIIATLGIVYTLGGDVDESSDDLKEALQKTTWSEGSRTGENVYSPLVAIAIMVFFALCMQCGSTVAVIAREASWGWAIFAFLYMTILAWIGAVLVYQLGSFIFG